MAKKKQDGPGRPKVVCPVSRDQFLRGSRPLVVNLNGEAKYADVKQFASGRFGWFHTSKMEVEIQGVRVQVQAILNMVVIGSQEAPAK